MIGIAQDDGRINGAQVGAVHRFDRGLSAHGHEYRRLDPAVGQFKNACARRGGCVFVSYGKTHGGIVPDFGYAAVQNRKFRYVVHPLAWGQA